MVNGMVIAGVHLLMYTRLPCMMTGAHLLMYARLPCAMTGASRNARLAGLLLSQPKMNACTDKHDVHYKNYNAGLTEQLLVPSLQIVMHCHAIRLTGV